MRFDVLSPVEMMDEGNDTIFALATPPPQTGGSGIAVIRVSGPDAFGICASLSKHSGIDSTAFPHKKFILTDIEFENSPIDHCGIIAFHKPHSYTGEDVIEFHLHGGVSVLRALENALLKLKLRPAEPGEFTRRAFLNGNIDLIEAESIAALVGANGAAAHQEALRQRQGRLSEKVMSIRSDLRDLLGKLEVDFDYPEERVDGVTDHDAVKALDSVLLQIKPLIDSWDRGRILKGFRLAIIGRPNVGKSSLLNALLEEDRAIVTDTPGTTRDVVSAALSFNGVPAELLDTAGVRSISDHLDTAEAEGIRRSWSEVERAHIVLLVFDTSVLISKDDVKLVARAEKLSVRSGASLLLIASKSDLFSAWEPSIIGPLLEAADIPSVTVSAVDGSGIDELRNKVAEILGLNSSHDEIMLTEVRHMSLLTEIESIISETKKYFESGGAQDVAATELWGADRALGRILGEGIGAVDLDEIFSRFCVGK